MTDGLFDDGILRLEARALVKAASRAAHTQPVHGDNLPVVLCFSFGLKRIQQQGQEQQIT